VVAAWGVMAMVDENAEIDLDGPVQRHLTRWRIPESQFDVEGVTVRRLLSHMSGLSVFPASESFTYPSSLEETLSQSYGAFGRLRLVRKPGTDFEYNNGNYLILQLLIEEVTGVSFTAYMRHAVLEPLRMESSAYAAVERDRIAVPYDEGGRPLPLYQTYHNENCAASGGLYTTAGDLATFVAATMRGSGEVLPGRGVLRPETVSMMISIHPWALMGTVGLSVATLDCRQCCSRQAENHCLTNG
jgi:CubicO group peptidase (beta-lactamase class C family)